jgi:tRNA A-37 threonylcarbamoyl transferase component Bud32
LFSKHCWIDEKYNYLFVSSPFSCYEDFVRDDFGKMIRVEQEKSITFFDISQVGKKKGFYLKREFPKWYKLVKRFINFKDESTLATLHELQLIRFYQENNISVVVPVAWGEKRVFGIPVSGFLVQEEVLGVEFTSLMKSASRQERIKLMRAYGKLIAELHSKGIISSAVRVTDLICTSSLNVKWDDISFTIIDRENGEIEYEKFTFEKCVHCLSFIMKRFFVFIGKPTGKEVCYFLKSYLEYLNIDAKPILKKLYFSIDCPY